MYIYELMDTLEQIAQQHGTLKVITMNSVDNSLKDDLYQSTSDIRVEEVVDHEGIIYRKDYDYDKWCEYNINSNEDNYMSIVTKGHPELYETARKVWWYDTTYKGWEDDVDRIETILKNYYNNMDWEKVVLIINR